MQAPAEFIGRLLQLDRKIGQTGRHRVVKKQRLDTGRDLKHSLPISIASQWLTM
jgi:hypothetical protein